MQEQFENMGLGQDNRNLGPEPTAMNVDDQVIPAMRNAGRKNNQPSEYPEGEEVNEEEIKFGEPIPQAKMRIAQPLIDVFSEVPIRKVMSKTWNLREQGLSEVED